ncbi:hypothetical protein BGZ57DRAFT_902833 [Hyaloscypha finlandica]|nr:hypothetical protein BGZ57DRAFT_902833 [Hyaloscypha finlandica]
MSSHSHSQPVNLSSPALALFALPSLALRPPSPRHMTCCPSSECQPIGRSHYFVPWCLTPCIREPPGAPSRWRT